MNFDDLIKALDEDQLKQWSSFDLLQEASFVINSDDEDRGREIVLRILDKKEKFSDCREIVNSLVRQVGLMPYLEEDALDIKDSLAYEFFKPFNDDGSTVFHRAQAAVYYKLLNGDSVILSAPTSFGKSKIIDSLVQLNKYKNIVIVVPTIALIDETRRRLSQFSPIYRIITQVSQNPSEKNIFIFTAERLLAYGQLPDIDFFVVDEFYKIDSWEIDETRTVSLNQAFYKLIKMNAQFYLLGPNIQKIPDNLSSDLRCSFFNTDFATVISEVEHVETGEEDDLEVLGGLIEELDGQTLIFCKSPNRVNQVARMLESKLEEGYGEGELTGAAQWIGEHFHERWVMSRCLPKGVGIHHGRLPRSLAQLSVKYFNEYKIKYLVCTSTLIEGVNTSAKNIIILDHLIGTSRYDYFTFNNIKGRGGRMFEHFIGRVYVFNDPPQKELPFVDFPFYSQGKDVPESLLIQLDSEDLNESSARRLNKYFDQSVLPIEVIRENSTLDPESQVELARRIESFDDEIIGFLLWEKFPEYKQLEFCCELIWEFFVGRGSAGINTGKQLGNRVFAFSQNPDVRTRIDDQLIPGPFSASGPDDAVESVLAFDRNWAGFNFPRYLMALDKIQRYILKPRIGQCGDYSFFATQVEYLFRKPSLIALEEFGLPIQISEKIDSEIDLSEDIDLAIAQIRGFQPDASRLGDFEMRVLDDVKVHI